MGAEVMTHKKPSRRDLLRVIAAVQHLIGEARGDHANDRDPEAFERAQTTLARAIDICDEARQCDAPEYLDNRHGASMNWPSAEEQRPVIKEALK
jgi:hypothetical protein